MYLAMIFLIIKNENIIFTYIINILKLINIFATKFCLKMYAIRQIKPKTNILK